MRWYRRWLARRAHARLVAQERADWRTVRSYKIKCVVIGDQGEELWSDGYAVFHAQQNGLGERRIQVGQMPRRWASHSFETHADLLAWAAAAEPRAVPMKEVA